MGIFSLFRDNKKTSGGANPPLRHIAFIMDGNGRWAKKRGLPREVGHRYGAEAFKKITEYCLERGVEVVTVYAFSTENWRRPKSEVDGIMRLFVEYLKDGLNKNWKTPAHIRFLGDTSVFSEETRALIKEIGEKSSIHSQVLNIAINYGGRDDILHAVNTLISEGKREISAEDINSRLYTAGLPEPDLVVRTGGEWRLSNFLTWQSTYSELYFTKTLWPDMTKHDVDLAFEFFEGRERRFGDVKAKKR